MVRAAESREARRTLEDRVPGTSTRQIRGPRLGVSGVSGDLAQVSQEVLVIRLLLRLCATCQQDVLPKSPRGFPYIERDHVIGHVRQRETMEELRARMMVADGRSKERACIVRPDHHAGLPRGKSPLRPLRLKYLCYTCVDGSIPLRVSSRDTSRT